MLNQYLREISLGVLEIQAWPKLGFPKECHPSLVHLDLSWALSEYATSSQSHHLEAINRNDGFQKSRCAVCPSHGLV